MCRAFLMWLLLAVSASVWGQTGGQSVYPFLQLSTSSNYASLGGFSPSVHIPGPNAVTSNPALPDSASNISAALNMVSYVAGIRYGSAFYTGRLGKFMLTGGAQLIHYGDFSLTDEAANELGTFQCRDMMTMMSLSRPILPNLTAGITAKYINSDMETYHSQGLAVDMGFFSGFDEGRTSLALTIYNLGSQITTYSTTRESLPLDIRLGVSRKLQYAPLRFTATVHSLNHPRLHDDFLTSLADHFILSAELFPEGVVSLKGGFNVLAHNDLYVSGASPFAGFSFGIDVRLKRFSIQYSRQCISPAASANMLSMEVFISRFLTK